MRQENRKRHSYNFMAVRKCNEKLKKRQRHTFELDLYILYHISYCRFTMLKVNTGIL